MKKKILALSIIFIIIAGMLGFITNVNAVTNIEITGNSVWRSSATTANINFMSDTAGTVYYKITNSNVAPVETDIIVNGTDGGSVTANTTKNISLTELTSGAKYVHIVVKNGDNLSNVLTIAMPYDLYYFDNFEAYNLNSYPANFTIKYNGNGNANQKIINATQTNNVLGNVFKLNGSSGWASDQRISIDANNVSNYIYFEADAYIANVNSLGVSIGLGDNTGSRDGYWTGSLVRMALESNKIRYGIADDMYDIKDFTIEKLHWYNIKIVLDNVNKKFDVYVDNVKANTERLDAHATNKLTYFALTVGNTSSNDIVYFDNIKLYSDSETIYTTLVFNYNGATGENSVLTKNVTYNSELGTLPTPTKTGFTFSGWYLEPSFITEVTSTSKITEVGNINLYAKWNPIPTYTVTFNTNGGSTVASQTIIDGETLAVPTEPTKTDYTFGGWYTDPALTTQFNFSTPITSEITIYAKWNPILYTVTFNTNGGSAVDGQMVTSEETATLPTEPTKASYTFGGWYADTALTTEFNFTTAITADTTIYAKWTEAFSEKTITKTEDDMTLSAKGTFSGEPVLVITKTESGNEGYNSLVTLVKEDKEVIGSYDVSITGGTYEGELELTFTVGKQYEGDKITIYHEKASGDVETLTATVKEGKVVITVSELSPFMLVADKEVVEQKDATPKTGDNVYLYIILVVITLAGVFVTSKLMKKSR